MRTFPILLLSACWITDAELTKKLTLEPAVVTDTVDDTVVDTLPEDTPLDTVDTVIPDTDSAAVDSDTEIEPTPPPYCVDQDVRGRSDPSLAAGSISSTDPSRFETACADIATGAEGTVLWAAPTEGCWIFDTLTSSYDTILSVHDDCSTERTCNDDIRALAAGANSENRSAAHLELEAREEVILVVDAYNTESQGTWQLNARLGEAIDAGVPTNTVGTITSGRFEGEVVASTLPSPTLDSCFGMDTDDRLFRWKAPYHDNWRFEVTSPTDAALLSLHRLCSVEAFQCATPGGMAGTAALEVIVGGGEEIIIRVARNSHLVGDWSLSVTSLSQ